MSTCDFCGGPRVNGLAVRETEDGWCIESSPNPASNGVKFSCRECGKERVSGQR